MPKPISKKKPTPPPISKPQEPSPYSNLLLAYGDKPPFTPRKGKGDVVVDIKRKLQEYVFILDNGDTFTAPTLVKIPGDRIEANGRAYADGRGQKLRDKLNME